MTTIKHGKAAFAIVALLAASSAFSATMNKADYAAAKDRIEADYKADRTACDTFSGNAKDICKEEGRRQTEGRPRRA